MEAVPTNSAVVPFSLKSAPSLIERIFPAQKVSVEAQKERKANVGQTLTVLGAYWKGRKPLVLVRACLLGALLPATEDPEADLSIFEKLMGIDDAAFLIREDTLNASAIASLAIEAGALKKVDLSKFFKVRKNDDPDEADFVEALEAKRLHWQKQVSKPDVNRLRSAALGQLSYSEKVGNSKRPEEIGPSLLHGIWSDVNAHLGTSASSIEELVEQLGVMRFGHRPRIADTFTGGGSIPFEAARLGCDAYASDLNPVACLLSWGAFNLLGADDPTIHKIREVQHRIIKEVDRKLVESGIEHDSKGNRAKAYLYCLEVTCPQTGWVIPVLPNLIISTDRRVIGRLRPNKDEKRIEIDIVALSEAEWKKESKIAAVGTTKGGNLVYRLDGQTYSTPLRTIRGDFKDPKLGNCNRLRPWECNEFQPRANDIFRERLYCIQWMQKDTLTSSRPTIFYTAPNKEDLDRETRVIELLGDSFSNWQGRGVIPDMAIEPGDETSRLLKERGWTYWHHLFTPRQLLMLGMTKELIDSQKDSMVRGAMSIAFARSLDRMAKLCRWSSTPAQDLPLQVFSNQALNTIANWGVRANGSFTGAFELDLSKNFSFKTACKVACAPANSVPFQADMFVTDPPYADAVNYHEITEFFIAWLRKNPAPPFADWLWDSRRPLAIQGDGDDFRRNMVEAYKAMAERMPDNGIQILMFTHQSASVWSDMAQIFWGAHLQVMAAWYIATETTSELKKGGYVQGTVILVARKREGQETGYKDEIVQEVSAEVADQIDTMVGLNQNLKGVGRVENLFEDADLQMAGYAAAMRVLTRFAKIDGIDMAAEALRSRRAGERSVVAEIIDFAVQVANEHMVPEHMPPALWSRFSGGERFYFKMMDIETTSLRKLDNYQNFAKAFRVADYGALMGNTEPNKARLKTAKEFKKSGFEVPEFGPSATRAVLYAIYELENEVEGDEVLSHLRDMLPTYHSKRDDLAAIAEYIARKREKVDETESRAARILHGLIRNERLG